MYFWYVMASKKGYFDVHTGRFVQLNKQPPKPKRDKNLKVQFNGNQVAIQQSVVPVQAIPQVQSNYQGFGEPQSAQQMSGVRRFVNRQINTNVSNDQDSR